MEVLLPSLITSLVTKYPVLMSVIVYVGLARLVMKPVMVCLQQIADVTPSLSDNALLAKLMDNKIYKTISFVLDYVASVKLPQA